jgi:hypothetical protein
MQKTANEAVTSQKTQKYFYASFLVEILWGFVLFFVTPVVVTMM